MSKRHRKDIRQFWVTPDFTEKGFDKRYYQDEWQEWFASGIRRCDKHAYPFVWHVMQATECPKCARRLASS